MTQGKKEKVTVSLSESDLSLDAMGNLYSAYLKLSRTGLKDEMVLIKIKDYKGHQPLILYLNFTLNTNTLESVSNKKVDGMVQPDILRIENSAEIVFTGGLKFSVEKIKNTLIKAGMHLLPFDIQVKEHMALCLLVEPNIKERKSNIILPANLENEKKDDKIERFKERLQEDIDRFFVVRTGKNDYNVKWADIVHINPNSRVINSIIDGKEYHLIDLRNMTFVDRVYSDYNNGKLFSSIEKNELPVSVPKFVGRKELEKILESNSVSS